VVCGDDPIHQVEHARAIREAQHVAQLLGADFPAFTLHDGLIQDGQSVARDPSAARAISASASLETFGPAVG